MPAAVGADVNAGLHALRLGRLAHLDPVRARGGIANARGRVGAACMGNGHPLDGRPVAVGATAVAISAPMNSFRVKLPSLPMPRILAGKGARINLIN